MTDLLAFRDGIVTIGSRLAGRGLVDYRARRAALADLTEVPVADWAARPSMAGARQGHPDRGRVFAAGDAQGVLREAGSAEDYFAAEQRTGPDWQVRHVAEAEFYSLTGAGYTELARHQPRYAGEAISRLTIALGLRGADGARNATLDTISLAEAHLADHDLSQAVHITGDAIHRADNSASRRIRKRLRELAQQLGEHRGDPDVTVALEQISTLAPLRPSI